MFHVADGWFFDRLPDGGVYIIKRKVANEEAPIVVEAKIGPETWVSIITEMAHPKADKGTVHETARALHAGDIGGPERAEPERAETSSTSSRGRSSRARRD